eukprot:1024565-Pleurochrysis_carterae.AAC.1
MDSLKENHKKLTPPSILQRTEVEDAADKCANQHFDPYSHASNLTTQMQAYSLRTRSVQRRASCWMFTSAWPKRRL